MNTITDPKPPANILQPDYQNPERRFKKIFEMKGKVGPIAEKAIINFKIKSRSPINKAQRIHHFAVGHAFKQIDTKEVFKYSLDSAGNDTEPKAYLHLQRKQFSGEFIKDLCETLESIRNIQSHYIHNFSQIRVEDLSTDVIAFLKESFSLACIHILMKEKNYWYETIEKKPALLTAFLVDKFYYISYKKNPTPEDNERTKNYEIFRSSLKEKTPTELINQILFIEVSTILQWHPTDYDIFEIQAGKYLSFDACLFLLSIFLYKSEANQMIASMKGYKRNGLPDERSKREIFSFFSKKFTSQDIDSEENHLIKFRDIVQYLNKYPVSWNKVLEVQTDFIEMVRPLKQQIFETAIHQTYAEYVDNENSTDKKRLENKRFIAFALEDICLEKEMALHSRGGDARAFTKDEIAIFRYDIDNNPVIINAWKTIDDCEYSLSRQPQTEFRKIKELNQSITDAKRKIERVKSEGALSSPRTARLMQRIDSQTLVQSFGRNHDRFMAYATRFLAEEKQLYFGQDAKFKMYRFYTVEEQVAYLDEQKGVMSKKDFEKLKFHQGKLICYDTYKNHLVRYPSWSLPFVEQNNAIYVAIDTGSGKLRTVCIQRALMVYLLQHVLSAKKLIEGKGLELLQQYYPLHQQEMHEAANSVEEAKEPEGDQRKLLPRRLLKASFSPDKPINSPDESSLHKILNEAREAGKRYESLLLKARENKVEEDFTKRNKGKQFKLRFVRKAWNLMYFKDLYIQRNPEGKKHHKQYNITKEEFNDFCRWMFAMDEIPRYKQNLRLMFMQKQFLNIPAFAEIFNSSDSLDAMYRATLRKYERWIQQQPVRVSGPDKYQLNRYQHLLADYTVWHINLSHFLVFLSGMQIIKNETGQINYPFVDDNSKYLVAAYYGAAGMGRKLIPNKPQIKLYNKLNTARLEDSLLYEMAFRYLDIEPQISNIARKNVDSILTQNLQFNIIKENKTLYRLEVPFNKLDAYVELLLHKQQQEIDFNKNSFLAKIPAYLAQDLKAYRTIEGLQKDFKKADILTYANLHKFENHIMTASREFTEVLLALEAYYVFKNKLKPKQGNYIEYKEIQELKNYFTDKERNQALHFGIPDSKNYNQKMREIEEKFIKNELPGHVKNQQPMTEIQNRICDKFMRLLHPKLIDRDPLKTPKQIMEDAYTAYKNSVLKPAIR